MLFSSAFWVLPETACHRVGRLRQSWLRTVEDDLHPLSFDLATARRCALDRLAWQLLVETATFFVSFIVHCGLSFVYGCVRVCLYGLLPDSNKDWLTWHAPERDSAWQLLVETAMSTWHAPERDSAWQLLVETATSTWHAPERDSAWQLLVETATSTWHAPETDLCLQL